MTVPSGIGIETSFPLRSTIPEVERFRRKRSPRLMTPFFINVALLLALRLRRDYLDSILTYGKGKMHLTKESFQARASPTPFLRLRPRMLPDRRGPGIADSARDSNWLILTTSPLGKAARTSRVPPIALT